MVEKLTRDRAGMRQTVALFTTMRAPVPESVRPGCRPATRPERRYATRLRPSPCRSYRSSWFQLAKMRLTSLLLALPSGRATAGKPRRLSAEGAERGGPAHHSLKHFARLSIPSIQQPVAPGLVARHRGPDRTPECMSCRRRFRRPMRTHTPSGSWESSRARESAHRRPRAVSTRGRDPPASATRWLAELL